MPTFAELAAFVSVAFAAVGLVVLTLILVFAWWYRQPANADEDEAGDVPALPAPRHRVPPAYGIALGCFAVAAAFGVLGVVQRSPASADRLMERIRALERRLEVAEVELETRAVVPAALAAIERRSPTANEAEPKRHPVAGPSLNIEAQPSVRASRTDAHAPSMAKAPQPKSASVSTKPRAVTRASENARRSAAAEPLETRSHVAAAPRVLQHSSVADAIPRSESPNAARPSDPPAPVAPSPIVAAPPPVPPPPAVAAPAPPAVAAPAPPIAASASTESDARRAQPSAESSPPTLAQKVRRDWEAIKQATREGGDDWVEGWRRLRRLFAD